MAPLLKGPLVGGEKIGPKSGGKAAYHLRERHPNGGPVCRGKICFNRLRRKKKKGWILVKLGFSAATYKARGPSVKKEHAGAGNHEEEAETPTPRHDGKKHQQVLR